MSSPARMLLPPSFRNMPPAPPALLPLTPLLPFPHPPAIPNITITIISPGISSPINPHNTLLLPPPVTTAHTSPLGTFAQAALTPIHLPNPRTGTSFQAICLTCGHTLRTHAHPRHPHAHTLHANNPTHPTRLLPTTQWEVAGATGQEKTGTGEAPRELAQHRVSTPQARHWCLRPNPFGRKWDTKSSRKTLGSLHTLAT